MFKVRKSKRWAIAAVTGAGLILGLVACSAFRPETAEASPGKCRKPGCKACGADVASWDEFDTVGGNYYWLRSPEDERRVVMGLYNRYCIRCHGVDGRGIWDIPDVPDFTNPRWQASRSDGQLARMTIEGRGAVMPPFRGVLTVEEAFAMARYLRTLVPGTEVSPPDLRQPAPAK
jgi:mono/diheme cytochrome c family protein